ncbi:MAG TPA: SDR family oxidoreductase [Aggregatilineales bacterium]|nr:SDR family oxidoreductase [Anaerolineales bacterium]HRE46182.1 SDR family oxidoreductase [Aggregatilineales bacterium]
MRVLITGGAGFLGSHLADRFLAEGHTVLAMDNLLTGSTDNIAHLIAHPQFTYIQHDISESIPIEGTLDAVLNFASPASPIDYLKFPIETLKVGSHGTLNGLEVAKKHGARFLMASTSEIYGDPLVHPQTEDYWGNVSTIGPRGCYDEAKRYAESLVMAYHRTHGVDTRIVRIFNTYGERMRLDDGRVVPNFVGQAIRQEPLTIYGDGMQTRSFCYVSDLIDGIYRLLMLERSGESMYPVNIGNPVELSILEFAKVVNMITDNPGGVVFKHQERIEGDPQTRKPDISRARRLLGWEPNVLLPEGLERTIRYFETRVNP